MRAAGSITPFTEELVDAHLERIAALICSLQKEIEDNGGPTGLLDSVDRVRTELRSAGRSLLARHAWQRIRDTAVSGDTCEAGPVAAEIAALIQWLGPGPG